MTACSASRPPTQRRQLVLDLPRLAKLRFQQGRPRGLVPFRLLGGRHARQLAHRVRDLLPAGRRQQGGRADERSGVPLLGLAQGGCEGAENAAGALEAFELRPATVEHVGEIGMEGEAREEAVFSGGLRRRRGLVELRESPHHADHVRAEGARVPDVVRLEEPPTQHLRHVLLLYRLHSFLALAQEHVEEIGDEPLAHVAALLARVGGEQGGHDRGPVHLHHRLGESLEEIHDAVTPYRAEPRLLAGVHQHLVHEDEGREAVCARALDELHEERLGGRCLALLVQPVGVDCAKSVRSRELERQHAPGMAQRARLPVRPAHPFDAPLDVDLVEAERDGERAREIGADVLAELLDRR